MSWLSNWLQWASSVIFWSKLLWTSVICCRVGGGIDYSSETQSFSARSSGFISTCMWHSPHLPSTSTKHVTLNPIYNYMKMLVENSFSLVFFPPNNYSAHFLWTLPHPHLWYLSHWFLAWWMGCSDHWAGLSIQPTSIPSPGHVTLSRAVHSVTSFNMGQGQQVPSLGQSWKAGLKTGQPGNNISHELLLHRSPVHSKSRWPRLKPSLTAMQSLIMIALCCWALQEP